MSTTLTIDPAGALLLPRELLEEASLQKGGKVEVDVSAERIVVKPVTEDLPVKIVRRGKLLVIEGLPASGDVVAAIKADREDRDARLARAALGQ